MQKVWTMNTQHLFLHLDFRVLSKKLVQFHPIASIDSTRRVSSIQSCLIKSN